MTNVLQTRAWRVLRDQVVQEEPTCRIQLPGICTTISTTGDHKLPVETHPHLALVRSNVQGACAQCNHKRGSLPLELLVTEPPPPALAFFY